MHFSPIEFQLFRKHQLWKQFLGLERNSSLDVTKLIKSQIGLHSTDYWTPYLSIYARIGDYDSKELFQKINSSNQLFRINAFRGTLHVVHEEWLPPIIRATADNMFKRLPPSFRNETRSKLDHWLEQVTNLMLDGPISVNFLGKELPQLKSNLRFILNYGFQKGVVIRGPASHAKSNRTDYQLLELVSPKSVKEIDSLSIEDAMNTILLEYVKLFGPITEEDFSWWLPYPKTKVRKLLNELNEIVKITIENQNKSYYICRNDLENLQDKNEKSKDILLLPYEDHFAKAFAPNHRFYVTEKDQNLIFPNHSHIKWPVKHITQEREEVKTKSLGEKRPSIWVDGKIVGRWEINSRPNSELKDVAYYIFDKEKVKYYQKEIDEAISKLEEFINHRLVPIS